MLNYTLLLHGYRSPGAGLPGALVRDLLDAVDRGAKGAVRLRLEGRSSAKGGFPPAWVSTAAGFQMSGFHAGLPGVELRIPTLGEALPHKFAQEELFPSVDPASSALSLMGRGLADAQAGNGDSDAYDSPLLRTFGEFREVFRHGVQAVELRNGRPDSAPVMITPAGIAAAERLQKQTPRPQRVRVAGKVDAIRHSDRAFTLVMESGEVIRGILAEGDPDELAPHFGRATIVGGMAQFRPSGSLLRIDADLLEPADEHALSMWSEAPRPLFGGSPDREVRRQGSRSGINAFIGAWPGEESEDEIFAMLEEIS
ncbi:MAG TPA: hypothetical protein VGB24_06695 [Longimicrobium sp.]|jgi:hypothetical protein|uniref:hypothetical protein n=1 Tax=Longimicrobium sp. TaxID=2029185 RepID=UPI002ED87C78